MVRMKWDFVLLEFMADLQKTCIAFSLDGRDRSFRAHGHTLHDIATLRTGEFLRIPDIVICPGISLYTGLNNLNVYALNIFF